LSLLALVAAGCAATTTVPTSTAEPTTGATASTVPVSTPEPTVVPPPSSATGAAGLRSTLARLLTEHVYLASAATGSALAGRSEAFNGAVGSLEVNSIELSLVIGTIYGPQAGNQFLELWRRHIGFVVDYTTGLATDDQAMADAAVEALLGYTFEFGDFLHAANPNLDSDVVADLVEEHILTLKAVIDAQASGNPAAAYTAFRMAAGHMDSIAAPLAGAIAVQFPAAFSGTASSPPAGLRTRLTVLLGEHVALASEATGAALAGRQADFDAAAASLDANSVDLSAAIGSVYGDEAGNQFLDLWRRHIGFVVDYTTGLATGDQAKADDAVEALLAYTFEFGDFLNAANPNLDSDVVADLVEAHILTLKAVIDAQAGGDPAVSYAAVRTAIGHMPMIADPLAEAIVVQFPGMFR
jgi:hypothetical protein